ncbi:flavin reductase family protein (plasmid) [Rhodococcus opacus]|uniref:flavin reductase family protein n=1 Tax=Rhodococcus opacus TaxID=37919 RepID=UPI0034D287F5
MNPITAPTDPAALRAVFANIPQTVIALCGLGADGRPRGLAASSFTTVSLAPPIVSVAMAHTSTTWPTLRDIPRLGVSVLAEDQDTVCRALSARGTDRFADVHWHAGTDGAVLLDDAVATMECTIVGEIPAGDHQIVLLRIEVLDADPARDPLVFHGSTFRTLAPIDA